MKNRGKTTGFMGNNGAGVSVADINRGYLRVPDPDVPPLTRTIEGIDGEKITVKNYERFAFDPETGREYDPYHGGFLRRDPHNPNER